MRSVDGQGELRATAVKSVALCSPPGSAVRELAASALLAGVAMAAVQVGLGGLAGNDSYYHLKMARLLPELGFVQTFPWLHWTIFREQFVSHHHGFHLLLTPFVLLAEGLTGDPVLGARAALCIGVGATGALFCALLRVRGVAYPLLWVLLLACLPWHFWLRMSYLRAPIAALPLILLAVLLVIRNRGILLALTAFVFAHVYGGVVLLPLVPLAFVGGTILTGRFPRRPLILLGWTLTGLTLGLCLNPYFPHNFAFLKTQLFQTGLGAPADVGNEWRPYDTWGLLRQGWALAAVWALCLAIRLRRVRIADAHEIALLLLNLGFLVLTLKARRFIEYWPLFALLNAADLSRGAGALFGPAVQSRAAAGRHPRLARGAIVAVVAVIAVTNLRHVRGELRVKHDHQAIAAAMEHLRKHSPAGSLVFTDDWDVFPVLFYYNHHNYFMVGLDPVFTRSRFPALWERYKRITRGQTPSELPERLSGDGHRTVRPEDIRDAFGADYVFVASDHPKLYRTLRKRHDLFVPVFPANLADGAAQPPAALFEVLPASAANRGRGPELETAFGPSATSARGCWISRGRHVSRVLAGVSVHQSTPELGPPAWGRVRQMLGRWRL